MLQQTRVAAVIPFYTRFLERFPSPETLAAAPEQDLLAAWAGLGYYSRARNLQRAAREIAAQGRFPFSYDAIRALPGVGDYTAAAIASIAFDLPHAAVDGNVLRVLARLTSEPGDIGSTATRRRLASAARTFLNSQDPSRHNQALMELGALVCLPRNPGCSACPLSRWCQARLENRQHELPIKLRKPRKAVVHLDLLLIRRGGKVLMSQRPPDGTLMPGFWELPSRDQLPHARPSPPAFRFRHTITYHNYRVSVSPASIQGKPGGMRWVIPGRAAGIPISTIARKALCGLGLFNS